MNSNVFSYQSIGSDSAKLLSLDQVIKLITYCSGQVDAGDWEECLQQDPILAAYWQENDTTSPLP